MVVVFPMWKQDLEWPKPLATAQPRDASAKRTRAAFTLLCMKEKREILETQVQRLSQTGRQASVCRITSPSCHSSAHELLQIRAGWLIRNEVGFVNASTVLWARRCLPPVRTFGTGKAVPLGKLGGIQLSHPACVQAVPAPFHSLHCTRVYSYRSALLKILAKNLLLE